MTKKIKPTLLLLFFFMLLSMPLLAQDTATIQSKADLYKLSIIIGGAIITLAAAAGAFCQAKAISSACEGISRNPGSAPHIRFLLIFGLVLIETLVIYALLISIIVLMVQWGKYIF
ncbi:MAG: ATP synthase F0 subunit C [Candidatus Aminicenantes bacterium]|nr:ATP synthase F0 subunit C [Candidatus Aminicenantes bacterium]